MVTSVTIMIQGLNSAVLCFPALARPGRRKSIMFDESVNEDTFLKCLQRIEASINSDKYEPGGIWTVGGPAGTYTLHTPYNTECEWSIFDINSTPSGSNLAGEASRVVLNLASAARASYTAQQFAVGDLTSLKIIFNMTAITGGTTPTVTFKVSSVGADGTVVQLEQAAAANSAFVFDYNIGPGTDGKEFGNTIQVDMITTGSPTSVTFSASIIGKGPVIAAQGNGVIAISAGDPTTVPVNPTLGSTSSTDGNAYNGFLVPIIFGQSHDVGGNYWQPLGRGANLYITINPVSGLAYVAIAFRRKLDRAIPTPPRSKAHTHSTVQSRRGARTFTAGFEAQYPHDKYIHETLPETEDLPNLGNVEEMSPAQVLLAKMRNGGR